MRFHTIVLPTVLVLLVSNAVDTVSLRATAGDSAAEWRALASGFIDQIDEDDARDRALYELNQVRVLAGELHKASKNAPRIENSHLRCLNHFLIAKYFELAGDHTAALAELQRARRVAVSRGFTFQMVDAYLDIAKSPDLARAYVAEVKASDQNYGWQFLAKALAQRGYVDLAFEIVRNKVQASSQQRALASMGAAAATGAHIDHAERIAEQVTDAQDRDRIWISLIRALKQRSRGHEAEPFVARITDPSVRVSAETILGRVDGRAVDEVTNASLREQIAKAELPAVKRELYDALLKKHIADKDVPAAEASIEAIVQLIENSGLETETSKFGNVNDSVRIALARSNYLQLAAVLVELGEQEASREMLDRAAEVIIEMPDSSGLAKMLQVSALLNAQIGLGDLDGARRTVTSTQAIFWRVGAGRIVEAFIEAGDVQTARGMAESILESKGAGGADVVSAFLLGGRNDMARELLDRVDDSRAGADILREVGQAMIQLEQGELLRTWLTGFTPAAQANLCIGAARMAGTFLTPATSDRERVILDYLTVSEQALPTGIHLSDEPYSNPGVHLPATVPGMALSFQYYRSGEYLKLKSAATAGYEDAEGQVDIHATCYELTDAATASQVLQETNIAPFKDWYFQKGPFLVFVSSRKRTPKCLQTRDRIHEELASRDLVVD